MLLSLSACTGTATQPLIIEGSESAPIQREEISVEESEPAAETHTATDALLLSARDAMQSSQPDNAITYLERAIRIDPRNPKLWIELSIAHLADANTAAAHQHVRKAIALANGDEELSRQAWLQMANIQEKQGNANEARSIRSRYANRSG